MISPVSVNAFTLPLAPGAKLSVARTIDLLNPFRGEGMLIDEISFETYQTNQAIGNVWVELQLGTDRLTSYPLPLWLLGRDFNPGSSDEPGNPAYLDFHTFKLKHPIYVPSNQFIQPFFWNRGGQTFVVNVTMRGRSLGPRAPVPEKRWLPWVTSFVPDPVVGAPFAFKSNATDLHNPFDRPIQISEFVGRIKDGLLVANSAITEEYLGLDTYTVVRMYDSAGRILVRDKTPFGLLFSVIWKYWAANSELGPQGYYTIYLDGDYSNPDGLGPKTAQAMLSMIGYREI